MTVTGSLTHYKQQRTSPRLFDENLRNAVTFSFNLFRNVNETIIKINKRITVDEISQSWLHFCCHFDDLQGRLGGKVRVTYWGQRAQPGSGHCYLRSSAKTSCSFALAGRTIWYLMWGWHGLLRSRSVFLLRVLPFSFFFLVFSWGGEWGRKDQKEKRKKKNTTQKNRMAPKELETRGGTNMEKIIEQDQAHKTGCSTKNKWSKKKSCHPPSKIKWYIHASLMSSV